MMRRKDSCKFVPSSSYYFPVPHAHVYKELQTRERKKREQYSIKFNDDCFDEFDKAGRETLYMFEMNMFM